jgi:hypothetical protein
MRLGSHHWPPAPVAWPRTAGGLGQCNENLLLLLGWPGSPTNKSTVVNSLHPPQRHRGLPPWHRNHGGGGCLASATLPSGENLGVPFFLASVVYYDV